MQGTRLGLDRSFFIGYGILAFPVLSYRLVLLQLPIRRRH